MRHLALVAVGALGKRVAFQCIVGATSAGARFGVSPFRIWHGSSGFLSRLGRFELDLIRAGLVEDRVPEESMILEISDLENQRS
jgi:hypothetical protein